MDPVGTADEERGPLPKTFYYYHYTIIHHSFIITVLLHHHCSCTRDAPSFCDGGKVQIKLRCIFLQCRLRRLTQKIIFIKLPMC